MRKYWVCMVLTMVLSLLCIGCSKAEETDKGVLVQHRHAEYVNTAAETADIYDDDVRVK